MQIDKLCSQECLNLGEGRGLHGTVKLSGQGRQGIDLGARGRGGHRAPPGRTREGTAGLSDRSKLAGLRDRGLTGAYRVEQGRGGQTRTMKGEIEGVTGHCQVGQLQRRGNKGGSHYVERRGSQGATELSRNGEVRAGPWGERQRGPQGTAKLGKGGGTGGGVTGLRDVRLT